MPNVGVEPIIRPIGKSGVEGMPSDIVMFGGSAPGEFCISHPSLATHVRTSEAQYYDENTVIQTAAIDEPRYDYDPVDGLGGWLFEKAKINYCWWNRDLTQATWVKVNSTIDADANTAPNGAAEMDTIVENAAAATQHGIHQSISLTISQVYTWSAFVKPLNRTACYLSPGFGGKYCMFDLSGAGSIGDNAGIIYSSIERIGTTDTYRVAITFIATSTAAQNHDILAATGTTLGNQTYNGLVRDSIAAWGAQHEDLELSSVIYTIGANRARFQDGMTLDTSDILTMQDTYVRMSYRSHERIALTQNLLAVVFTGLLTNSISHYLTDAPSDNAVFFVQDGAGASTTSTTALVTPDWKQDYEFRGWRTAGNAHHSLMDGDGNADGASTVGAGTSAWNANCQGLDFFSATYPGSYKITGWELGNGHR